MSLEPTLFLFKLSQVRQTLLFSTVSPKVWKIRRCFSFCCVDEKYRKKRQRWVPVSEGLGRELWHADPEGCKQPGGPTSNCPRTQENLLRDNLRRRSRACPTARPSQNKTRSSISPDLQVPHDYFFLIQVCFETIFFSQLQMLVFLVELETGANTDRNRDLLFIVSVRFPIYSLCDPCEGHLLYSIIKEEPGCTFSYSILLKIRALVIEALRHHSAIREMPLGQGRALHLGTFKAFLPLAILAQYKLGLLQPRTRVRI